MIRCISYDYITAPSLLIVRRVLCCSAYKLWYREICMLPYGIYLLSDKLILLTFVVSPLIARLFDYNWLDRQIGRIKGKVIFVITIFVV